MAEVGERAPNFALKDQAGNTVSLSDFGVHKKVLLVFYVLAWTPI